MSALSAASWLKNREKPTTMAEKAERSNLIAVALLFLRLGFTAFGGPAAHIAIMQDEVVRRRRWISSERFLDLLGAANLLPGPSSTELAIFIGFERAGGAGLVLAGACFIVPAAIIVAALAWAYVRFGGLPQVEGALYGVKPVVIAVVAQAIVGLAPKALKRSVWLSALAISAGVAVVWGLPAIIVLLGAGALSAVRVLLGSGMGTWHDRLRAVVPLAPLPLVGTAAWSTLGTLFLVFLKVGAIVFGSGYVLLAFLRADLVDRLHWLTEGQLVDAVAVGQVTPGPVFTTATFIGYLVGGAWGALVATVGIFLPGFVFVAAVRPLLARLRASALAGAFLDGANAASLALMATVGVALARATVADVPAALIALAAGLMLFKFKTSSSWLVLGGAAAGLIREYVLVRAR